MEEYNRGFADGMKQQKQDDNELLVEVYHRGVEYGKEQMKPIRVVAEDAWEISDGRVFAEKLRIVDDGCEDAIEVPGFNVEFTLYKEGEK